MPLSTGAAILSVCLLLVGLVSVQMEVQNIRTGVRVRQLLRDQELLERVRWRYRHLLQERARLQRELSTILLP